MNGAQAHDAAIRYGRITATGLVVLVVLAVLQWVQPQWDARLQNAWLDTYQAVWPRQIESTPVTVVEIDAESLARIGQWPWPRDVMADLIHAIAAYRPAAIGIDILMTEPDRLSPERVFERMQSNDPVLAGRVAALVSNDSRLALEIAHAPVVLAVAEATETPGSTLRVPPITVADPRGGAATPTSIHASLTSFLAVSASIDLLDRVAAGHGLISIGEPGDIIRRVPLVSTVNGTLAPSLSIEMMRVALRAPALRLIVDGAEVEGIAIKDFAVRTEHDGTARIYFSPRDPRRFVSAFDVLAGKVDPARFEQKLVLIGTTGSGLVDYQNTPLNERMPGSEIQAQLLENLHGQTLLHRPTWFASLETGVFLVLGLLLIWAAPRWRPRNAALLAIGCVLLITAVAFAVFKSRRLLLDAATPGLSLLVLFGVLLVVTLAESTRQRRTLERIVQTQRERAAHVAGELAAAQRIQTGMLPRADLLRGDSRIDLAAVMAPAREVGGDLYDFFRLDRRRLFVLVGDVAGKGLSASMFMAVSKALYKSAALNATSATVGDLMTAVNVEVSRDNSEMFFVTAFAAILDLDSGMLDYCNAGHENPYAVSPDRATLARLSGGGGPPLCAVDGFRYPSASHGMQAGELLCVVTDGVTEAQNASGELYGSARLQNVLLRAQAGGDTAAAAVDAIRRDVDAFAAGAEPSDDMTIFVLRWMGARDSTS